MKRLFFTFVVVSLILPLAAKAELLRADLRVDGIACPFCAFGIEKKLRAVDGVREVGVLLDEGVVQLGFAPGNRTTLQALEEAVGKAGFSLAGLRLVVRGTLQADPARPTLDAGGDLRLLLLEQSDGRLRPIAEDTQDRIRASAGGKAIEVEGDVHGHQDALPALVVERFEATQ